MDVNPPLYPDLQSISRTLHQALSPEQKKALIQHCLIRACVFAEIAALQYLLVDPEAQTFVDLSVTDDDGVGLVSLTIHGYGAESDRDVEREECVRLLIQHGAHVSPDVAGWSPLHYASLFSPPTVISHLMTHGCSPFAVTKRNLTALDIVTGHTVIPGREDIALLLEAAMRGDGWTGGRMEDKRRELEQRLKRKSKQRDIREGVARILDVSPRWWGVDHHDSDSDWDSEDEDDAVAETIYTPPADYCSMLVWSPDDLPNIFDSLILNFPAEFRNSQPANALYLLARFACLTCDHNWLEELLLGATDAIEETFFNRSEDVTALVFWLYNTTVLLHLLQCDTTISEACEMLGAFELMEELINSIFVFIIRFAERRIDQLLDTCLLDHSSLPNEMDSVQFESEWSFFRTFSSAKRKSAPIPSTTQNTPRVAPGTPSSPPNSASPLRPPSPSSVSNLSTSSSGPFSSLRQSFSKKPITPPLTSLFKENDASPAEITSFLTALHTLLTLSGINPALTIQLWSQVMYWTSCEMFNRILTRKKYICRSRAMQINMNVSSLEEWVIQMGLPRGVQSHFAPLRDLLNWLQCLSSINEFSDLVATIQTLKNINPLQMRRAVREYRYEVNESRMTEECVQYLTQLQKDWERHRVKLGVEALRKEMVDRDRDTESISSLNVNEPIESSSQSINSLATDSSSAQTSIDMLFESETELSAWEPTKTPPVLGELRDSRFMLPLFFPSDPRMLATAPGKPPFMEVRPPPSATSSLKTPTIDDRSASRASSRGSGGLKWHSRTRRVREISVSTLHRVDKIPSGERWVKVPEPSGDDYEADIEETNLSDDEEDGSRGAPSTAQDGEENGSAVAPFTELSRKASARKARASHGGDVTPVEAASPA